MVDGMPRQLPPGDTLAGDICSFGCTFDGGGNDITVGSVCDLRLPYGCTISKVSLIGVPAGQLSIDVRVADFASFPAAEADSIVGSAPPELDSASAYEDAVLTGWEKNVSAGSVIRFVAAACAGVVSATVIIEGVRTE